MERGKQSYSTLIYCAGERNFSGEKKEAKGRGIRGLLGKSSVVLVFRFTSFTLATRLTVALRMRRGGVPFESRGAGIPRTAKMGAILSGKLCN